jgi:hypothetical protein
MVAIAAPAEQPAGALLCHHDQTTEPRSRGGWTDYNRAALCSRAYPPNQCHGFSAVPTSQPAANETTAIPTKPKTSITRSGHRCCGSKTNSCRQRSTSRRWQPAALRARAVAGGVGASKKGAQKKGRAGRHRHSLVPTSQKSAQLTVNYVSGDKGWGRL